MSDTGKQNISALMDGALGAAESRFLLRRMQREPGLIGVWSRYHLVRDCLQGQPAVLASEAVADRVMRQLQDEGGLSPAPRQRGARRWVQLGAGGAIAASVAVAALMLVQPPSSQPRNPVAGTPAAATPGSTVVAAVLAPAQETAAQDFSLLLGESRSPWLYVQPAAATRRQSLGYLNQSVLYARQPQWLRGGNLHRTEVQPPRAPVYVLRSAGQPIRQHQPSAPVEIR